MDVAGVFRRFKSLSAGAGAALAILLLALVMALTVAAEAEPTPKDPAAAFGLWVLAPAVVAILLAILFRQVVPALVIGILVGAYMMFTCTPPAFEGLNPVVGGFRLAAETYFFRP